MDIADRAPQPQNAPCPSSRLGTSREHLRCQLGGSALDPRGARRHWRGPLRVSRSLNSMWSKAGPSRRAPPGSHAMLPLLRLTFNGRGGRWEALLFPDRGDEGCAGGVGVQCSIQSVFVVGVPPHVCNRVIVRAWLGGDRAGVDATPRRHIRWRVGCYPCWVRSRAHSQRFTSLKRGDLQARGGGWRGPLHAAVADVGSRLVAEV